MLLKGLISVAANRIYQRKPAAFRQQNTVSEPLTRPRRRHRSRTRQARNRAPGCRYRAAEWHGHRSACAELPGQQPSAVVGLSLALRPDAVTTKPATPSSPGTGSTVSVPPRGMPPVAINTMLSKSFTRFLASNARGRFQASVVLPSSIRSARRFFRHRRDRSGRRRSRPRRRASRQNCNLARGLMRALLDQLEAQTPWFPRSCLPPWHLDAVDDRTDRADQVMADARTQQRRKIEGADGKKDRKQGRT